MDGKVLVILATVVSLSSCFNRKSDFSTRDLKKDEVLNVVRINSETYWKSNSPMDFIQELMNKGSNWNYVIEFAPPLTWLNSIDEDEIRSFAKRNMHRPSAFVSSAYEDKLHDTSIKSTAAKQCEFLLVGKAKSKYPPTLCSIHYSW